MGQGIWNHIKRRTRDRDPDEGGQAFAHVAVSCHDNEMRWGGGGSVIRKYCSDFFPWSHFLIEPDRLTNHLFLSLCSVLLPSIMEHGRDLMAARPRLLSTYMVGHLRFRTVSGRLHMNPCRFARWNQGWASPKDFGTAVTSHTPASTRHSRVRLERVLEQERAVAAQDLLPPSLSPPPFPTGEAPRETERRR